VADELTTPEVRLSRKEVIRYVLGVALGIGVLLLLFGKRGELVAAWHQLRHADISWVAAAVLAETLSLWTFAHLQHRVLHLSGASIPLPPLYLLSLANDAIANSVPGEPAISSAYRYRFYRRHHATGASAGWTIFTILIAQAIGMSLILLLGVVVALTASAKARETGVTLAGLVIVAGSGAILIRRDLVLRLASGLVRALQRVTGHPRGSIGARVESTLARMREIPLSTGATIGIVALATGVWGGDFLCLLASFGAVHAAVPWAGVLLAYGVAQVAGSFPVVPGGIGIVEGSLAVILAAYGADRVSAVAAALAYRIVSFWLAIAIGWISVAVIAHQARRSRRDAGRGDVGRGAGPGLQASGAPPPD
jgi:putative heme transporter